MQVTHYGDLAQVGRLITGWSLAPLPSSERRHRQLRDMEVGKGATGVLAATEQDQPVRRGRRRELIDGMAPAAGVQGGPKPHFEGGRSDSNRTISRTTTGRFRPAKLRPPCAREVRKDATTRPGRNLPLPSARTDFDLPNKGVSRSTAWRRLKAAAV